MTTIEVRNPRSGEIDYRFESGEARLPALAAMAREAQPEWAALGPEGRGQVLARWAAHVAANGDALLEALSADTGRHLIARTELGSLAGMVAGWTHVAREVLAEPPERDSATPGVGIRMQRVPHALVGNISPWNFPFLLSMLDAIPALMAGCAVIIKPSEVTPRFAAPLAELIGAIPELAKVLHVVPGDGATGAALIDEVDALCFTGSVATGRKVAVHCAERFIPCFLELGGKDPAIVLPSADPEHAARIVLRASVQATGQACQSLERVYVHESLYQPFLDALVSQATATEFNYPDARAGNIGPLIFGRQADIIAAQLAEARERGATILCGGEILMHGGGRWIAPTVVTGVDHGMQLMSEETFGPVIPVMAYRDTDEAVALANDSKYGLSAAVIGADLEAAEGVARRLNVGAVSINDGALTTEVFDCEKQAFGYSGLGESRSGASGIRRFTNAKAIMIRRGEARGIESLDERLA